MKSVWDVGFPCGTLKKGLDEIVKINLILLNKFYLFSNAKFEKPVQVLVCLPYTVKERTFPQTTYMLYKIKGYRRLYIFWLGLFYDVAEMFKI